MAAGTDTLRPIEETAAELGIPRLDLQPYGSWFVKVRLPDSNPAPRGKLILVTGMTPTPQGEGKTVTTIGLAQSLRSLGYRAAATIRQPSMGPIFGLKGGATGGGMATVIPPERINLHFTGDFHAITAAHNLLAALIDNHVHHRNEPLIDPQRIVWPRALDVNDRALRHITVSTGRPSQFVITAASEVMAIFALATGYGDLRRRLAAITAAYTPAGQPVTAGSIGATGAMLVLLRDALLPNLAQTADGTPVFVHAGPFANIAHGTASVLSQNLALRHADFVVNEAGFGADLGFEKYMDFVMPSSGLTPSAAVVVATVRAITAKGSGNLSAGLANLGHHLGIVARFGVPAVVAVNHFPSDTQAELAAVADFCDRWGVRCGISRVYGEGAAGGLDLARKVIAEAGSGRAQPRPLYMPETPLLEKVEAIARNVYGASSVQFSPEAREQAASLDNLPVCMAKTPLSLTHDPKLLGAPGGWTLPVNQFLLASGAGFVVAVTGATLRMPGMGKSPQALRMDLSPEGDVLGL